MTDLMSPQRDFSPVVARLLVLIAGLNLNGFAYMATGVDQLFSPLLLAGSVYLVLGFGRWAARDPMVVAFAAAMFLYLAFGYVFSSADAETPFSYALTYSSTVLLFAAVAAYVSSRSGEREVLSFVRFTKYTLLLACASVMFSHELRSLYVLPLSSLDRNAGLFGNANEAGIVGAVTLAMVLSVPSQRAWVNILHALIALAAVGLSFSKSSMLVTMLILVVYTLQMRRPVHVLLAVSALVAMAFLLAYPGEFSSLSTSQQARIDQVWAILSGELTDETTTGRTALWSLALDRIETSFPWGTGIGQFHHMAGGIQHEGVWMGAHNTYLMVWGEAGLLAFVALGLASFLMFRGALRWSLTTLPLLYFVILQFDMLSAHNVLGLRFHNVMLGLCVGMLCWARRTSASEWLDPVVAPRFGGQRARS